MRKNTNNWSQPYKERLRVLVEEGRVMPDVLETLPDLSEYDFKIAPDILQAIKANDTAWINFQGFSGPYIRIRISHIEAGGRGRRLPKSGLRTSSGRLSKINLSATVESRSTVDLPKGEQPGCWPLRCGDACQRESEITQASPKRPLCGASSAGPTYLHAPISQK